MGKAETNKYNEIKEENEKLKKTCREYERLLRDSSQKVWTWDVENDIYSINIDPGEDYFYCFSGNKRSIEDWKKTIHPEDLPKAWEKLKAVLVQNQSTYENQYRIKTRDGSYKTIVSKGTVLRDEKGKVQRITGLHWDITEKLDLERTLFNRAYYDSLTKLPNKEKVFQDYNALIQNTCGENGTKLVFCFMDIDNFGYINSVLGYAAGNEIIKDFSEYLTERYPEDLISRISADEFLIIYRYKGEFINVEEEAKRFLKSIRQIDFACARDIRISISFGISIYKEHGEDFYELLKNADIALYCAKRNGKNRFEIYHENMELKLFNYVDIINQIRVGLSKKEFYIYYQPIVSTETGAVKGLEALIRWKHSKRGYIPPGDFIPVAEETGSMKALEKWIIEEVFKQWEIWGKQIDKPLFVTINLSSKGLLETNLVEFLDIMLEKYNVNPKCIKFEVTETAMLTDMSRTIGILRKMIQKGFEISLDDFGTGYSSLNYLKNLPIKNVKLDKGFIETITDNKKDRFLVESIISLSHSFDLKVIAEGVEAREQVDLLNSLRCDYIQGYYFGKPMDVWDAEHWIRKNVTE